MEIQELTKFSRAYKKLKHLEFSNNEEKFLHKNQNEEELTLGGVYEKYHKTKLDWDFVHKILEICNYDYKRASVILFADRRTKVSVAMFFKTYFWDKLRLDEVQSQKICNEIFLSAVHIGLKSAVKLAQKQVGTLPDGIIGTLTIKALNRYDENKFDTEFDKLEIENYNNIIENNKSLNYAHKGFVSRANFE